ncbi:MAG: hypothetical protein R2940_09170 [Syntrophotaleaceae bacterium]
MTLQDITAAVTALDPESKKAFLLQALPELAKEAMQDQMFLMQLFPVFLNILQESGIDLQQLLKLAVMFGPAGENTGPGFSA